MVGFCPTFSQELETERFEVAHQTRSSWFRSALSPFLRWPEMVGFTASFTVSVLGMIGSALFLTLLATRVRDLRIGDQAFSFIGTKAFTGKAGQLRYGS